MTTLSGDDRIRDSIYLYQWHIDLSIQWKMSLYIVLPSSPTNRNVIWDAMPCVLVADCRPRRLLVAVIQPSQTNICSS